MLLFLPDQIFFRVQFHKVAELPVPGCNLQDVHSMLLIVWDTTGRYLFLV